MFYTVGVAKNNKILVRDTEDNSEELWGIDILINSGIKIVGLNAKLEKLSFEDSYFVYKHDGNNLSVRCLDKNKSCEYLKPVLHSVVAGVKVTNIAHCFQGCTKLKYLDLSEFETDNVVDMNSIFGYCSSLFELDLSKFNTKNVEKMNHMFLGCSSLQKVKINNFDTSSVNNMEYMFNDCTNLIELDLSSFDTRNVSSFRYMFANCLGLKELNLNNFSFSSALQVGRMFENCVRLKILLLSGAKNVGAINDAFELVGRVTTFNFIDMRNEDCYDFVLPSKVILMRNMNYCLTKYDGVYLLTEPSDASLGELYYNGTEEDLKSIISKLLLLNIKNKKYHLVVRR